MHLTSYLLRAAADRPDKTAVIYGREHITYATLLDRARRAGALFVELGVQPGERIAVQTFNTPGFIVAAFGAWFAGGVLVPVNHKFTAAETQYAVDHSGARVGVVAADLVVKVHRASTATSWLTTEREVAGLGFFDGLLANTEPLVTPRDSDQDAAAEFLYTSGTTGSPKACVHTHRSVSAVAPLIVSALGFDRDERFLLAMPIWHASPLNNWLLSMVFLGATTILQREYHPGQVLASIGEHRATAFFGAPIAYFAPLRLAEAGDLDLNSFDLSSIDKWIFGGAPLGFEAARSLTAAYKIDRLFQVYGMSEMGPVGTALYPEDQLRKAGSIGRTGIPGVDLRVVSADGTDAIPGGSGEVWLRADTRMLGYHENREAEAEAFAEDWFRTGDVVRLDEDGYLFVIDRLKDVIIVGGENVHSQEVEEALRGFPRIDDVAVVGRPDNDWGERVVAVYVSIDGEPISVEELREFLAEKVARYKLPREAVGVSILPRTPSGKLVKGDIRRALPVLG